MKKKIISVILAGTMMMGTLAGCGGNKTTETENKTEGKTDSGYRRIFHGRRY